MKLLKSVYTVTLQLCLVWLVNWYRCRFTMKIANLNVKLQKFPVDTQVLSILVESCMCNLRVW